jgi:hypothetical protein
VIASVINDRGVIDLMNARLVPDHQAGLTPGEAVAGLMRHGLGGAQRPWSLTPQCFASTPLERLCHDGIRAERCHRCTRGRPLDEASADGGDRRCHERALGVCARDGIDLRGNHLAPTSFARRGESIPDSDEQAMTSTPGSSREHRPDVQQAVLALMVAQDGGIPLVSQRGDGPTADLEVFQARTQAWLAALKKAPRPRSWIADATRSHEDHAIQLRHLGCLTRSPHPMGAVSEAITPALAWDRWPRLDDPTRSQRLERCPAGMAPRGRVGSSPAALARAEATRHHARPREDEAIHRPLLPLPATRVATPEAAHEALTAWAKGWTAHQVDSSHLSAHPRDARPGRPTPRLPVKANAWHIQAHVRPEAAVLGYHKHRHACCVSGTPRCASEWRDTEVIAADQRQSRVEGGCRLLNDPLCVVSSWLVNQPGRIQGRLRVMTRA